MKALIVDGNNLMMRAIFATQHSGMSFEGINTGPVNTFLNSIAYLIRAEQPEFMGVAWDSVGPNHRHALSAQYKANRSAGPVAEMKETAFPQARAFCDAAGIDWSAVDGYEADDIIASWWSLLDDPVDEIVIASNDKDFLQLTGENPNGIETEIVRFSSAGVGTERWNAQKVRDDKGYEPHQWPLLTALTGDPSDNVIGIPGIGPKRALAMLKRHDWDLTEAVVAEKTEYLSQVQTNLKLVNLRHPRPAAGSPPGALILPVPGQEDGYRFEVFLKRYGLQQALRRFEGGTLWHDRPVAGRPLKLS